MGNQTSECPCALAPSTPIAIVSYVAWASSSLSGARMTMTGTPFQNDSAIDIASALIADVQRRADGEVRLLVVCHGGDDPAAKEHEIRNELIAAATSHAIAGSITGASAFDASQWLADFAQQCGWWSAMADGRVGLGFSRCHCTEAQMAEARRMIGALSKDERDAVEAVVRERAGVEAAA